MTHRPVVSRVHAYRGDANVAGSIPVTQAGFGVFERGVAGVTKALGVPELQAATYAIFVHVLLTTPHFAVSPLAAAILRVRPSDVFFFTHASEEAETAGSAAD